MTDERIEPCFFCDGRPVVGPFDDGIMFWMRCECGALGPTYPTRIEAIAKWNNVARLVAHGRALETIPKISRPKR